MNMYSDRTQIWLEARPMLAFQLLIAKARQVHFPKIKCKIEEETEVLFISGVMRAFDSLLPFLEKGGRVVFIEPDIENVGAFLALADFIPHSNIDIVTSDYTSILKKVVFKKQQFIGLVDRRALDE